ncbi:lysozyme [Paraburkholderia antibiotica]|uniref:Lysozyme n=1 Tax=Paraburkholderia antibiotica TaxID=2728839 RepID=A0A7X9X1T0_9BURK|nr:lysozyme [Paraburkholderia antibiotica]NML29808.1 lysozyme [Paraburkholderia antibiotica]
MPDVLATAVTNTDVNSSAARQPGRLRKPWRISSRGLAFMAEWESGILNGTSRGNPIVDGFVLKVYDDGLGFPTVGMGHKVTPANNLRLGDTISLERAEAFLRADLADTERAINRDVDVPLHQYEYDALVSVLWNAGPYRNRQDPWQGTRSRHLANILNSGRYEDMPDVILHFVATHVLSRRRSEANLFANGIYNARH